MCGEEKQQKVTGERKKKVGKDRRRLKIGGRKAPESTNRLWRTHRPTPETFSFSSVPWLVEFDDTHIIITSKKKLEVSRKTSQTVVTYPLLLQLVSHKKDVKGAREEEWVNPLWSAKHVKTDWKKKDGGFTLISYHDHWPILDVSHVV